MNANRKTQGAEKPSSVMVLDMSTGAEMTYTGLTPIEALVSAAILNDKRCGDVSNGLVRAKYEKLILVGQRSASIGNLAVLI